MSLIDTIGPPWSREHEQAVLGALLLDSGALLRIADKGLQAGHFYDQGHRLVFGVIAEIQAGKHAADVVSVFELLRERGHAEEIGLPYLNDLAGCVPSAANIGRHADLIIDRALQRTLIEATDRAMTIARAPGDIDSKVDAIAGLFTSIKRTSTSSGPRAFGELILERTAHWENLEAGKIEAGIATSLPRLNFALGGGIKPGRNIVLAGRPGSGKSSLAWTLAQDVAARGKPVLVLSMEMQAGDLVDRAAANMACVPLDRIVTGKFEKGDWTRITDACDEARRLPIYVDDRPALTLLDIRAKARQVQQQAGSLGMIVVDYLQLASAVGRSDSRHHQIEAISRGMKALAKELNTTVLLLSQLTRESEKDEPELSHLKESGAIEEDADTVILLHALGIAPEGGMLVLAKVAKNRQGPRGRIALAFDGATQRWQQSAGEVTRNQGGSAAGAVKGVNAKGGR